MPPRAIAQVTFERDSGLAEDRIVNTFHFEADAGDAGTTDRAVFDNLAPGLATRLQVFYEQMAPRMSSVLNGPGKVTLYDFSDAKPRIPRYTLSFPHSPGSTALPSEVALCLSFRAANAPGVNPARRRGRVFLGPFGTGQVGTMVLGADSRPAQTNVDQILAAAKIMARGGAGTFRLAIYSPTTGAVSGQDDQAWNDATEFWIDDAWDTQRRRGATASKRTTLAI